VETDARTLAEAAEGADVLVGLSQPRIFTKEIIEGLAKKPIVFAMANPEPEIRPELARQIREDIIIATGRSDYPNQINNVMCFPFLFRAALDCRATQINEAMKMATAQCLADLAKKPMPKDLLETAKQNGGATEFGPDYIIPNPFDPRLVIELPVEIVKAAIATDVAQKKITDFKAYQKELAKISKMN
jgi:malate dehydrogenase (oxaloacetate-decarboxylating)(NADP+)